MATQAQTIVILGAGQAGASVATRLRENGHVGRIVLIGDETDPPYQRPPLSKKYMTGEMECERLYLKPAEAYAAIGVELITGCRALAIDRVTQQVELTGHEVPLGYDQLVLTTGARPRALPEALVNGFDNILCFREMADANRLRALMAPGRRMLVLGGGYIGLETAAVARGQGLDVTIAEQGERILGRVACAETADHFRNLHQGNGVRILENTRLERFEGKDGVAERAIFADGRAIDIDLVVVGIGILPNQDLADAAGIDCDQGILVDEMCRTSDPRIHAAGDCARFPFQGQPTRLESVQNAIAQAEHLADSLTGRCVQGYAPVPWFWSDQYQCKLQIAGLSRGYTHIVQRSGGRPGAVSIWYFDDSGLIAVDAINDARAFMLAKRWLEQPRRPAQEMLGDPLWDPKTF
ncbi:FAD-dependent oxidoreductase [Roseobacter sp. N2S]|uniref:NAD(P)/FAD-dependent oxidoreductase n=1 Tax=Roseobacter sp. N2S TaxID=2663844 RepID=UPI000DF1F4B3|nr:FAD-dependent oxidoreductase [Roseobacter sp. N2S]MDR6267476.1 3-phenylpropionate/trans-cinnamate dioxygenase ferredoxin reductase subunit [Roseobacter sp. N2S]